MTYPELLNPVKQVEKKRKRLVDMDTHTREKREFASMSILMLQHKVDEKIKTETRLKLSTVCGFYYYFSFEYLSITHYILFCFCA